MRFSILLGLSVALIGCSDTDAKNSTSNGMTSPDMTNSQDMSGPTCDDLSAEIVDIRNGVSDACSMDADCRVSVLGMCSCPQAHATDAALDARIEAALVPYSEQRCDQSGGCNNEPMCLFGGQSEAACIDSVCTLIPLKSCESIEASPAGGVFEDPNGPFVQCNSAVGCELRTDTNLCGCPEAVGQSEGPSFAAALERANCSAAECATIDCRAGSAVDCVDNRCVLID